MYDDEVPSMGHFLLFCLAESSYVYFSPSAQRPFGCSSPSTRWPIKVLWMNFSAWLGCCRELGKLQRRSSPGRAIDALYARRSPQDDYTLNWEFPPLPSVLLDSFLHHALFSDFLRRWKGRIFCYHSYRVVTQCFILLVFLLQNKFCCLFVPWF